MMFQYFVKVVPTVYMKVDGEVSINFCSLTLALFFLMKTKIGMMVHPLFSICLMYIRLYNFSTRRATVITSLAPLSLQSTADKITEKKAVSILQFFLSARWNSGVHFSV